MESDALLNDLANFVETIDSAIAEDVFPTCKVTRLIVGHNRRKDSWEIVVKIDFDTPASKVISEGDAFSYPVYAGRGYSFNMSVEFPLESISESQMWEHTRWLRDELCAVIDERLAFVYDD